MHLTHMMTNDVKHVKLMQDVLSTGMTTCRDVPNTSITLITPANVQKYVKYSSFPTDKLKHAISHSILIQLPSCLKGMFQTLSQAGETP